jgi:microcystin-dependent protein
MAQPYVGEIRMFAGNFAPAGWSFCNGSLLPISENEVLFALIGTTYGGDGEETFALPDLQSRVPIHMGTGPGGISYPIAQMGGVETVTLTLQQIPVHTHALQAADAGADLISPTGATPAEAVKRFYRAPGSPVPFHASAIGPTGGSQPHENLQPFLCINYIISLFGIFPQQA